MRKPPYMLFCGLGAALGSLAAISVSARAERRPAIAPINASSHWIWGEEAGRHTGVDLAHSGIGGVTNVAAGLFWGALLGAYLDRRPRAPVDILRGGAVMGAAAGLLDYGLLPRRLSPGWELALSDRAVVLSMASMAGGAVVGGLAAQALHDPARTAAIQHRRKILALAAG